MKPLLIYTVVTNGYDVPCDVLQSDVADFICLTDCCDCARGWRHIPISTRHADPRRNSDELRWQPPWNILLEYPVAVRIDGSVDAIAPAAILQKFNECGRQLMVFHHMWSNTMQHLFALARTVPKWRPTVDLALPLYNSPEAWNLVPVNTGGLVFRPAEAVKLFAAVADHMGRTGCIMDEVILPAAIADTGIGAHALPKSYGTVYDSPMWHLHHGHVACHRHNKKETL